MYGPTLVRTVSLSEIGGETVFQLRSASIAVGISIIGCLCSYSLADTVTLKNGRTVEGVIVDDTPPKPLIFQYVWDGIQKTVHVPREKISDYTIDDPRGGAVGRQPVAVLPEKEQRQPISPPVNINTTADLRPLLKSLLPEQTPGRKEVVVVHLRGVFNEPNLHEIGNNISAGEFAVMLGLAQERSPEAVVLALDSAGGRVDQMDKIVDQILEAQSGANANRLVAWVELGGSAAALTALSCKEIVMKPHGRIGSATMVYGDGTEVPEAETAGEHKNAAMREARRRQVAALTNRPAELQLAMEKPGELLWHNPEHGFATTMKSTTDGWTSYDDSTSAPLALAAHECVKLGVAKGIAADIQGVFDLLEISPEAKVIDIDLADNRFQELLVPARKKALGKQLVAEAEEQRLEKSVHRFADTLQLAIDATRALANQKRSLTKADLFSLQRAIDNCHLPHIRRSFHETMKEWAPIRYSHYVAGIENARRLSKRAASGTRTLPRTLPVGAVLNDLIEAQSWALSGPYRGYLYHLDKRDAGDESK